MELFKNVEQVNDANKETKQPFHEKIIASYFFTKLGL